MFQKTPSNCEEQVIYLMVPYGEGCHYLAVKKLSAFLRRITSKINGYLNHIKEYARIKIFVTLSCLLKTLRC